MNAAAAPTPPREASPGPGAASAIAAGTAIAYAVVGWLALGLSIPPAYAAPLYPSAGLALAAALTWGRPALVGAFLGAFAVNTYTASLRGALAPAELVLPALIGAGAVLQAGAGRWLVQRFVGLPAPLAEPREVALFFAAGVLSCLASASVATAAFVAAGAVPPSAAPLLWWTWWVGDTLGVLIAAPIALTLVGRPRDEWAHRRVSLGLPLLVIIALLAAAILQVARWDEQRAASRFDRDARAAAEALAQQLRQPLAVLEATRSLYVASREVDDAELRAAVRRWVASDPALRAIGRSVWIDNADVAALEARRRAEGVEGFRVFDRGGTPPAPGDGRLMVITQIEPREGNAAALGLNQLSVPAAREAIERARRTDSPAASAGFRLTQEADEQRTGVVIYQALYDGEPATVAERVERTYGLLFVTVEPDRLLSAVRDAQPAYLQLCLVDTDPLAERTLLAGGAACLEPAPDTARRLVRPLAFAGRQWDIRVAAARDGVPDEQRGSAFLFSLVALGATALFGALLLAVTGRTRRIEVAVAERTADLRREVAERRRAEVALREREQRLRTIVDTAPVGIVYTDLDGGIVEANPALCTLLGRGADAIVGRGTAAFTHPDDVAASADALAAMRRGEREGYRLRKRYLRPDGSVVHAQVTVALLRDDDGRPYRTVGVVEDIGEHLRRLEAERERDAAAAASRAKSDFVSRMSHELRTPLNAMLGFAQLLELDREPRLAPHQADWAAQIQRAGWHLLHMINDTLDLSRIEAGTLRLRTETLDLRELVAACVALVESAARARRLQLAVEIDPQAPSITGDLTRVKQILTNLLSNAVKYNVDGGAVRVRTRRADGARVAIDVVDTGIGLTPEQLAHLFEPFNRLGREAGGTEGTGIGLVIALRLAELMDGSLTATSRAGETCFTLTLPAGAGGVAAAAPAAAHEPPATRYRQRLVHYVEDNATNVEVMRGILLRRPQIRLEVSASGRAALDAIRASHPSLVLLDMHLPDADGLELLRRLQAMPDTEDIPIVALSADATSERVAQALREGAAHYLTKPIDFGELLAVVDELLERQQTRFG